MKKSTKKGLMIWGSVTVGFILIMIIGTIIGGTIGSGGSEDQNYGYGGSYIATIYVEGAIQGGTDSSFGAESGYQHQWTLNQIDTLIEDDDNSALIVFINSPGGGVYESDELYLKVKEYEEMTGRPVYSVMGATAASGGYYVAAAGEKIFANRNTWTGSIGVTMGTMYDVSGFLDRYGVKTTTIASGVNKSMGSSTAPLTAQQLIILQSMVDEAYEQFVGIVAEERGMDLARVKTIADGRIYTAKQALGIGLVDEIGTLDEAISDLAEAYDLWDADLVDVVYEDHTFWGQMFSKLQLPQNLWNGTGGDAASILGYVKEANRSPVSYMCNILE